MRINMKNVITISLVSAMAVSCGTLTNGAQDAFDIEDKHPITVDQQTNTMTVAVDPTLSDLSVLNKARLRAFATEYNSKGHGPITISAPTGGNNDLQAEEMAADIRALLRLQGISYDNMTGASYRISSSNENNNLILSYSAYVANASACGNWSGSLKRRWKNQSSNNFGCATQANLAAMIADPRDLVEPSAMGAGDAERQVTVLQQYSDGAVTSTAPVSITLSEETN